MLVSAIGHYPAFRTVTEESRKPPVEPPVKEGMFQPHHKSINPVSVTGWVGVGAIATAIATGTKHFPKLHKTAAFVAVGSIATHIGMINARNHFFHAINNENIQA